VGRRSKARECALQLLYQHELTGQPLSDAIAAFWRVRTATDAAREMAERLARGTAAERDRLDRVIGPALHHWRLDRVGVVERTILRLAAYELIMERDTPASVVIDEAGELAKRFGEAEAAGFVNGVLDAIARDERRLGEERKA
jgi:N utilization substance protein B